MSAPGAADSAFALGRRGFHVFALDHPSFPNCIGPHGPATPCNGQRGKHPAVPKWPAAASADAARIGKMFHGVVRNIGVACGPSGLLVIDEDAPGELERFGSAVGQTVPRTFTVATSRGRHYYFAQPLGTPLDNSQGDLRGYKLDVRGAGGYVVGPGSVHASGAVYAADDPDAPIAELPSWLRDAISGTGSRTTASTASGARSPMGPVEPEDVDPDELPPRLREALADVNYLVGERSERLHFLVCECQRSRLTWAQTLGAIRPWCDAVGYEWHDAARRAGYSWAKAEAGAQRLEEWLEGLDRRAGEGTARVGGEAESDRDGEKPESPGDPPGHDPLPREPLSELGMARRLIHVHGDQLRYVVAWKRWLIWDSRRWAPDATGQVPRWEKAIARRVMRDAMRIGDDKERRARMALARRFESAAGVAGALTLAGTEPGVAVTPEILDADPWLLNCRNGTLDLRTGELRNHDPADLITKITAAGYDASAPSTTWSPFLHRVQPDPVMRAFLARLLGHALVGRVLEHLLPVLIGVGANGKSTLLDAVLATLGDYAGTADPELFNESGFSRHPTGVADLFGRRLVVVHESDAGRRLAEGTVKRLTGGDRVKARRMREDFWEFTPSHTAVMVTNHRPEVRGSDEGIWRRLRLVPFDVVIPLAERDRELPSRLAMEIDAVLAWLVEGFRDWQDHGLDEPDAVTDATADYRSESDLLGRFLTDRCLTGKHFTVRSAELWAAWCKWCTDEGAEPGTQAAFGRELSSRGFKSRRTSTWRGWAGLALAAEDEG